MKILISCYIFLVTLSVCLAKSTSIASIFLSPASATCKSTGLECSNCETLQYCSTGSEPLFAIKCADQSKLRPFCDSSTNTCVAKEPSNCVKEANKFHCPGEGLYPDLEHCRKYYQCGADGSQEHLSCGLTKIYTHSIQGCAKGLCRTYNAKTGLCRGKINKLIAYANDKNLYVLCLADAPKLFQCPKNEVFDETSVGCKFKCTQDGFFPSRDVEKYYFCYKVGKTYQEMILHCPDNSEFIAGEPGQGVCMPKEDPTTPEITTPEPTTAQATTPQATTPQVTNPDVTSSDTTNPGPITTSDPTSSDATSSDATSSDATGSDPTSSDATSSVSTTSDPTSSDATSSDATSSDATNPGPITTSDPTSSDATSSDATSSDATGSDPTSSDATSSVSTTSDPTSSGATSSDATSSDATNPGPITTSDPTSSDATSSDATSSDATGSDPTSSDATGSVSTTSDATSSDATSSDPTSSDATSSDATSSDATSADAPSTTSQ